MRRSSLALLASASLGAMSLFCAACPGSLDDPGRFYATDGAPKDGSVGCGDLACPDSAEPAADGAEPPPGADGGPATGDDLSDTGTITPEGGPGPADTSRADARPAEAGTPDAARPDAGAIDAGHGDAGAGGAIADVATSG